MKLFMKTTSTGFYNNSELISIAFVSEYGDSFYGEITDYDDSQLSDWTKTNVLPKLLHDNSIVRAYGLIDLKCEGTGDEIKEYLNVWLKEVKNNHNCTEVMEVWGDNIVFDWVLFCKLYGHLYNVPECIGLVPLDMCVLFKLKFGVPYVVREDYLGKGIRGREKKYNALNDALVTKACYEKLMNDMEVR